MTLTEYQSISQLVSVYQPVVSMAKGKVLFSEGLGRGIMPSGALASPLEMLEVARAQGTLSELNHGFLEAALHGWSRCNTEELLSINLDASCICEKSLQELHDLVQRYGLRPSKIILEICENRCHEEQFLQKFVRNAKLSCFLIAIDDLGKEHSNLDRILAFEPDIIKLDRELIENLHKDSNKRALVRAMTRFGNECCAQVVAEGVECWEEAFALMELGVDLCQGYYFCKPHRETCDFTPWIQKSHVLISSFRSYQMNLIRIDQGFKKRMWELSNRALHYLTEKGTPQFDRILSRYVRKLPQLECMYIMDVWGEQITHTHFAPQSQQSPQRTSALFVPAKPGDNHSLREYYIHLPEKGAFLSEPYLSQATGNWCRTFSRWLAHESSPQACILCIDLALHPAECASD